MTEQELLIATLKAAAEHAEEEVARLERVLHVTQTTYRKLQRFVELSPGDPDVYPAQTEAYHEYLMCKTQEEALRE